MLNWVILTVAQVTAGVKKKQEKVVATKIIPLSDTQLTLALFQRDDLPLDWLVVEPPIGTLQTILISLFNILSGRVERVLRGIIDYCADDDGDHSWFAYALCCQTQLSAHPTQ